MNKTVYSDMQQRQQQQQHQQTLRANWTGLTDPSSCTETSIEDNSSRSSSSSSHEDDLPTVVAPRDPSSYAQRAAVQEQWWHRTIVHRSLAAVRERLAQVERESLFLQQHPPQPHTALFARSEIHTGPLLGKGGFSLVYAIESFQLDPAISARCTPEQRKWRQQCVKNYEPGSLCLKHLNASLVNKSPKDFSCALGDLATEAAYLSRLDHPYILSLRGLPLDGLSALRNGQHDSYFIITERLANTLDQWIQQGKKKTATCTTVEPSRLLEELEYALQLAEAVQYLHGHSITFRDLKPQNIGFAVADRRIQLFDFGLCRELPNVEDNKSDDAVFQMSGVGTRRYMAPEIINGDGRYNLKADVYSWAIVTWEMMSGHKPYAHYSAADHCVMVCQGGERPKLYSHWPEEVRHILMNAWCANVRDRWTMERVVQQVIQVLSIFNSKNRQLPTQQQLQATTPRLKRVIKPLPDYSPTGIVDYVDVNIVESSLPSCSFSERVDDVLNLPILPTSTNETASSVLPFRRCISLEPRKPSSLSLSFRLDHPDEQQRVVCSAPTSPVPHIPHYNYMVEDDEEEEVSSLRLNALDRELTFWCHDGVEVMCPNFILKLPTLCS